MQPKRLIATWMIGLAVGTLVIAVTSPLFVRSYLPDESDSARGVLVPVSGEYRWRSEGYTTTRIGPHGMPGRTDVPPETTDSIRIALWGDSQAEGVCVADDDKLFAKIETASKQDIVVFPFARSGQDASDWLPQMPEVERNLNVDAHLILIVDLPDLDPRIKSDHHGPPKSNTNSEIASNAPAFVIQGGRYLISDNDGNRRQLRFRVGPIGMCIFDEIMALEGIRPSLHWDADWISVIRQASELPIIIVYAPMSPSISNGVIYWDDQYAEDFADISKEASRFGIEIVDTSAALKASAQAGQWPHGFHNGQIGSGHLNAIGYKVIAEELASVDWQKQDGR